MPASIRVVFGLILSCLWFSQAFCLSARAQGPAAGGSLDRILPAILEPSAGNFRLAEQAWLAQDPLAADVLTKYAMSLAYGEGSRFPQALVVMESIPFAARKSGPLRSWTLWLIVKTGKNDQASAVIQSLLDDLQPRADNTPTEQELDDVRFAGQLLAYLRHVANREEPLTPASAEAWWQTLAALPKPWRADLPEIERRIIDLRQTREREMQATFAPWKEKTEAEWNKAQLQLAETTQAEAQAAAELDAATAAKDAFAKQNKPIRNAIPRKVDGLLRDRNAIPRPVRPREPKGDKDGKVKPSDRSAYNRAMDRYEKEEKQYDRAVAPINAQLRELEAQLNAIDNQFNALQAVETQKRAAHVMTQKPLQAATRKEEGLKQQLADRPTWDSPGALRTLRMIDNYAPLSTAQEAARIQAARTR